MRRARERALRQLIVVTTVESIGALVVRLTLAYSAANGGQTPGWLDEVGVALLSLLPLQFWVLFVVWRQQVRAQAHSDAVEHRLDSMLRTTSEWGWAVDAQGTIRYSSDASLEFVGYAPHELVGLSMREVCDEEGWARLVALLGDPDSSARGWRGVTLAGRHRDGTVRWVETTAVPVRDGEGALSYEGSSRLLGEEAAARRLHEQLVADVSEVIDGQLVVTAFQPITRIADGHVVGVEALSRFPAAHGRRPDQWFRDAAAVGLGTKLERLALRTALLGRASTCRSRIVVAQRVAGAACVDPTLQTVLTQGRCRSPRNVRREVRTGAQLGGRLSDAFCDALAAAQHSRPAHRPSLRCGVGATSSFGTSAPAPTRHDQARDTRADP
jgi:PAS domain S-box-containing protein